MTVSRGRAKMQHLHHLLDEIIIGVFEEMGYSISSWDLSFSRELRPGPPDRGWVTYTEGRRIIAISAIGTPDIVSTGSAMIYSPSASPIRDAAMKAFEGIRTLTEQPQIEPDFDFDLRPHEDEFKITLMFKYHDTRKEAGA